ncbi:GNAT family N-acetyltransferase [Parasphingorhabdus halotolerans]|uniref:GNAT family N-acetyltransferase n=1 Tax=Parasphingorhabdus halotolerans TaxID=2725558 RepID=A0A6H2DN16_9SPHN|nr:GNAT family N-acetyltransferase [Parasphingorhabdus halotolerans]QJB70062.1 GNAT family N-acetyltransferase [Parasphingorhabdus halotolerans]
MAEFRLETERLVMREWHEDDLDAFHAINSDPRVMETLGPLKDREEIINLISRLQALQEKDGCCFWALETKSDGALIGWCGMIRGAHDVPVKDKLEIGWRLEFDSWGKGYVTEAAKKCIEWAADQFPDEEVWAITSVDNHRSRAVMQRLGMSHLPDLDFDHPLVEPGSHLLRHVTYCTKANP